MVNCKYNVIIRWRYKEWNQNGDLINLCYYKNGLINIFKDIPMMDNWIDEVFETKTPLYSNHRSRSPNKNRNRSQSRIDSGLKIFGINKKTYTNVYAYAFNN